MLCKNCPNRELDSTTEKENGLCENCLEKRKVGARTEVMNINKLDRLNKLKVVDYSCSGGELEYVMVAATEENKKVLKELGMEKDGFNWDDVYYPDEGFIDITRFAIEELGAVGWQKEYGFLTEEQARELDVDWI